MHRTRGYSRNGDKCATGPGSRLHAALPTHAKHARLVTSCSPAPFIDWTHKKARPLEATGLSASDEASGDTAPGHAPMKLRVTDGSTLMPGPMLDVMVMLFTYLPLAAAGLTRSSSVYNAP